MKPVKGWVVVLKPPILDEYVMMQNSFHTYRRFSIAKFTGQNDHNEISKKIWKAYRTNVNQARCIRVTLRAD